MYHLDLPKMFVEMYRSAQKCNATLVFKQKLLITLVKDGLPI